MKTRLLFILKQRPIGSYGAWNYSNEGKGSSGLYVSAQQVVQGFKDKNLEAESVVVVDNNAIDREINKYKPSHVFIEAFWVVPEKFDILKRLHPRVKFIVRNHSKTEFLANEGSALGWAIEYMKRGITVACNSEEATLDFKMVAKSHGISESLVVYLPNYYSGLTNTFIMPKIVTKVAKVFRWLGFGKLDKEVFVDHLNVGCFGAIRPLKNHLNQAIAAIAATDKIGLKLNFHINSNRVEGQGDPVLKNLRNLFGNHPRHKLIEHSWMPHDKFTALIASMDIVLQVSISETFNIVAADAVAQGVPVLVSDQIPWLDCEYTVQPSNPQKIADRIIYVLKATDRGLTLLQDDQYSQLFNYTEDAINRWVKYVQPIHVEK